MAHRIVADAGPLIALALAAGGLLHEAKVRGSLPDAAKAVAALSNSGRRVSVTLLEPVRRSSTKD